MMELDAYDLISLWEQDPGLPAADKALVLLAVACPGRTLEALEAMTLGERDRALLAMRRELFGDQLDGLASCSACDEQLEVGLRVSDLPLDPPPAGAARASISALGVEVAFRLPTTGDAVLAAQQRHIEPGRRALLRGCIVSATRDGAPVDVNDVDDEVLAKVAEHMESLDPLMEIRLSLTCSACEHSESVLFDIASYLWAELVTEAERLLEDVRFLAREYGWREADILSMSGRRRQFYLDRRAS